MPEEHLNERSLPLPLDSGMFSVPNPASLSNIRTFVNALRTATKGSDIPASDEGIRTILSGPAASSSFALSRRRPSGS